MSLVDKSGHLFFACDRESDVQVLETGLRVRLAAEEFFIPWSDIVRLDFEQITLNGLSVGVVRLTAVGGKGLVWTDLNRHEIRKLAVRRLREMPQEEHMTLSSVLMDRDRVTWPDGVERHALWLWRGIVLAAVIAEKGRLVEQANGAMVKREDLVEAATCEKPGHLAKLDGIPKSAWRRRIVQAVLLLATFFAFTIDFSWPLAVAVIGLLLFHEYGHAVAMKWSGVRVIGIFTLPFLGAVALAEDLPSDPWKHFVVAVMGPVFGAVVVFSATMGTVATEGDYRFLVQFALLSAGIHIFNMLPVGILDGGRMLWSVAFSIHRTLGTIVTLILGALSLVAAAYLHSVVLALLAPASLLEVWINGKLYNYARAFTAVGCTGAGVMNGMKAVWSRVGQMCQPDHPDYAAKAKDTTSMLRFHRLAFARLGAPTAMTRRQLAAAGLIYFGLLCFFAACAAIAYSYI